MCMIRSQLRAYRSHLSGHRIKREVLQCTYHRRCFVPCGAYWGSASCSARRARAPAGEPQRSGWYVGAGVGANWSSDMEQMGHNRDTLCYPNDDCSHLPGGMPGGYRWRYDLEADTGVAFEAVIGYMFDSVRLELSASQRKNELDQKFSGSSYLDGTSIRDAGNDIRSNSMASIGALTTRTLSLNFYYDFPTVANRIIPYLGAGLGLSFVEVSKPVLSQRLQGHTASFGSTTAIVQQLAGYRPVRYRPGQASVRRRRLQPEQQDPARLEAGLYACG